MAQTVLEIWNAALSASGGQGRVSRQDEQGAEAAICNQWYEIVRDTVQEAAWWASCKRITRIARVAEKTLDSQEWQEGDPLPGNQFAYSLPADYLRAWYLESGEAFELAQWRSGATEPSINVLHTNDPSPVLVYAARQDNPALWTAGQRSATIFALAGHIIIPLKGSERTAVLYLQRANQLLLEAQAAALNAQPNNYEAVPDWIAARTGGSSSTKFMYEFGAIFDRRGPLSSYESSRQPIAPIFPDALN